MSDTKTIDEKKEFVAEPFMLIDEQQSSRSHFDITARPELRKFIILKQEEIQNKAESLFKDFIEALQRGLPEEGHKLMQMVLFSKQPGKGGNLEKNLYATAIANAPEQDYSNHRKPMAEAWFNKSVFNEVALTEKRIRNLIDTEINPYYVYLNLQLKLDFTETNFGFQLFDAPQGGL